MASSQEATLGLDNTHANSHRPTLGPLAEVDGFGASQQTKVQRRRQSRSFIPHDGFAMCTYGDVNGACRLRVRASCALIKTHG